MRSRHARIEPPDDAFHLLSARHAGDGYRLVHGDSIEQMSRLPAASVDLIFADPPFGDDPWPWLLPACAGKLAAGGFVYAEAGHALEPSPPLVPWRRDKAGQVHYHLFALADSPAG